MGSPNQPRDARGRFASTGSASRADDAERRADQKRVDQARAAAAHEKARAEISRITRELEKIKIDKPTRRDDPYDVIAWEQNRAKLREQLRAARARSKEASRAAGRRSRSD